MTSLELAPLSVALPSPLEAATLPLPQVAPEALVAALAGLSKEQRLLLTMLHFEELDAVETALVLDLSVAEVLQQHAEALQGIHALLGSALPCDAK